MQVLGTINMKSMAKLYQDPPNRVAVKATDILALFQVEERELKMRNHENRHLVDPISSSAAVCAAAFSSMKWHAEDELLS